MPTAPEIDLHGHHWINAIGHSAGLIVFATLCLLLWRDAQSTGQRLRLRPVATTLLALSWDLNLLLGLIFRQSWPWLANGFAALAFASLSLLPAVLLDITLAGRLRPLRWSGYGVGLVCAVLHLSEIFIELQGVHGFALTALSAGFAGLVLTALLSLRRQSPLASLLCLLALAVSFLHFRPGPEPHALWSELLVHHAGIPLALYVVLRDYRFLLVDTFLRLAANGTLAALVVGGLWQGRLWLPEFARSLEDSTGFGLTLVLAALGLIGFSMLRERLQRWLTRQVFLRRDPADLESSLRSLSGGDQQILKQAAALIADHFLCEQWSYSQTRRSGFAAQAQLRFLKGDEMILYLGERQGGRIFLSEDVAALQRLATIVAREVDRSRTQELERLVMQAELRALQSQIHPHFLFNALNALYGSIPRSAADARRLVVSLSEVFRYFLTTSKTMVRLEEELNIVRAYLEIEQARLGPRLEVRLHIGEALFDLPIPVLSLQPLVENAIQHGVCSQPGAGWISVEACRKDGVLEIEIRDSGPGFGKTNDPASNRVGLENLRRRLHLTYGDRASLLVEDAHPGVRATLRLPAGEPDLSAGRQKATADGKSLGLIQRVADAE